MSIFKHAALMKKKVENGQKDGKREREREREVKYFFGVPKKS